MGRSNRYDVGTLFRGCPEFFQNFQNILCATDDTRQWARERYQITIEPAQGGKWYVDKLPAAATRWRLSNAFRNADFHGIGSDTAHGYSQQLRIAFAVQAFEAHAKVFGRKWSDHFPEVIRDDITLASDLRAHDEFTALSERLIKITENENLRERVKEFQLQDTDNIYPICVAIRHGFSHGTLRHFEIVSEFSDGLSAHIINCIEMHVKELTKEAVAIQRS